MRGGADREGAGLLLQAEHRLHGGLDRVLQGVAPGLQAGRQVAEGGGEIRVWVRVQVPQELVPVLSHDAAVL